MEQGQKVSQFRPRLVNEKKCGGVDCNCCVQVCPAECITIRDGKPVFNLEVCTGCGECAEACFASKCIEMVEIDHKKENK